MLNLGECLFQSILEVFFFLFFFFCGARDQTRGLVHARQVLFRDQENFKFINSKT
jgi:hypothetical protein